jgi:hypothetical protein
MKPSTFCTAILVAAGLLAIGSPARSAIVNWDIDPSQSFIRLNIPDQGDAFGNTTVRIRNNQNTSAWSDTGGRRAFLEGTIKTQLNDGTSIGFLGGQNNLTALESGSYRPDPAAFDPDATNGENPNGSYTNTGGVPAAFAARINYATISIPLPLDLARIAFRDVVFDIDSGSPLALDGGGAFTGGYEFGIASSLLDVDGLNTIAGQLLPDILNAPQDNLTGISSLGGVVTDLGGSDRMLTLSIQVPITFNLPGVPIPLLGSATGTIVAFATIPEPPSVLLAGFAALSLIWVGVRRRSRSTLVANGCKHEHVL